METSLLENSDQNEDLAIPDWNSVVQKYQRRKSFKINYVIILRLWWRDGPVENRKSMF